jgi:phosphatidylserine/phosphatidylglycerophosphate/cardiolipin synthase-like enzyme
MWKLIISLFIINIFFALSVGRLKASENPYYSNKKSDHKMKVLESGADSICARLAVIRGAKKKIQMETFVFKNDSIGRLFMQELYKKAKEGVEVELLVDKSHHAKTDLNQNKFNENNLDEFVVEKLNQHPKMKVKYFNADNSHPVKSGSYSDGSHLRRNHRKLLIADSEDGKVGVTGGRNIANEYYGLLSEDVEAAESTVRRFKDRDTYFEGEILNDVSQTMSDYFESDMASYPLKSADYKDFVRCESLGGFDQSEDIMETLSPVVELNLDIMQDKSEHFLTPNKDDLVLREKIENHCSSFSKDLKKNKETCFDITFATDGANLKDKRYTVLAMEEFFKSATKSIHCENAYVGLGKKHEEFLLDRLKKNPELEITITTNSRESDDSGLSSGMSLTSGGRLLRLIKNGEGRIHVYAYQGDGLKTDVFKDDKAPLRVDSIREFDLTVEDCKKDEYRFEPICNIIRKSTQININPNSQKHQSGLHTKSCVADGTKVLIGSFNFDLTSRCANRESVIVCNKGGGLAKTTTQSMEDLVKSDLVKKVSKEGIKESFMDKLKYGTAKVLKKALYDNVVGPCN